MFTDEQKENLRYNVEQAAKHEAKLRGLKHTPTPWEVKSEEIYDGISGGRWQETTIEPDVCTTLNIDDAEFIVRACNNFVSLLQALKILHDETEDYIRINNLGDPHHNKSMQYARDAIENAEKET